MASQRPSVFIGSSSEGLKIAEAIQVNLDYECESEIWSQGTFGLNGDTLETIVDKADGFDFAILVLTPDDMITSRGNTQQSPRDNVLLELGIFIGVLGRKRTFAVYDRSTNIQIPSDMAGVTKASYQPHASGNIQSSLGSSCTQFKTAVQELGLRPRQNTNADVTLSTDFQIICDLLDEATRQFMILMHEQNVALPRESSHAYGIRYKYTIVGKSEGSGGLGVNNICDRLPDAGLLQIDLRGNVTLTTRGHMFADWLTTHHHKADYFKSHLGSWGGEIDPSVIAGEPPLQEFA